MSELRCRVLHVLAMCVVGLAPVQAFACWEQQADELPAWAQRGRMIFIRNEGGIPKGEEDTYAQWQPVLHEHGARDLNGPAVAQCKQLGVPLSLRTEGVLFFGDDRCVQKIKASGSIHGWREHSWYWACNWWVRDPKFREAAQVGKDGKLTLAYGSNKMTNREMGNVLSPLLLRMRKEISQAMLTPRPDPDSTDNPLYPQFPYTDFDDCNFGRKGKPYDIYPLFGHLSMVWYDNPSMGADWHAESQAAWKQHFQDKFGVEIADPGGHPDELVRREWARFWAEAYGKYYDAYYQFHQQHIAGTAVPELCRGLNGKLHCLVGINASAVSGAKGARELYLYAYHKPTDFPGMLVEYWTSRSHGKHTPLFKLAMSSMRGRPTSAAGPAPIVDGEALAVNSAICGAGGPRWKAYVQFGYDNRQLLTNALQGNRVGVLYNCRSGLVANTLERQYDLYEQLDQLGIPYDVLVEQDLAAQHADFLQGYAAVLVSGGEFNNQEVAGLQRYAESGGHLVLIGNVQIEPEQYRKLPAGEEPRAPSREEVPLAKVFGQNSYADAHLKAGKGAVTVRAAVGVPNDDLAKVLQGQLDQTFRLADPQQGRIAANVLRQPKQGDALIIGLVNYTGQLQKDVRIALPKDAKAPAVAVISPDGYAQTLEVKDQVITVPELYNYSAVVIGPGNVVPQPCSFETG